MNTKGKQDLFANPRLASRITSANTQTSEKWIGYFIGPCLMYMMYYAVEAKAAKKRMMIDATVFF